MKQLLQGIKDYFAPRSIQIPVKHLGLATGQVVIVRRAERIKIEVKEG